MSRVVKRLSLAVVLLGAASAQKPELTGEVALVLSEQVQYEIRWQTLLPSLGRVEYGLDSSYGQVTAAVPALEGEHAHLLTNLTPGETYHYRLVTEDWSGNETVSEDQTFVAAAVTPVAQAGGAAPAVNAPLVDDSFENGLDESTWRVYNNTGSGELAAQDGQLRIQNVGNGTDYGQLGLALLEPIDLTAAPTTVTVSYTEAGNAEQNPGFWNVGDLEGDDNWNHPGIRATVSGEGVSPTATPSAEGTWTPAEGVEGLQPPYTLTWTITPPEGGGAFGSTMQVDGEEIYSGTFDPGTFNPQEAYFYLYTSSPTEEGVSAIDAVTVEQEGQGAGQLVAQAPTLPEGAVAAWLFDEGEGENVADAAGENDGTFTNPEWAEGKFGSAAQITPGQNYISVPGSEALSPTDAVSVTAWVYLDKYGEGEFPNRRVLQMGTYDPESDYGIEDNSYRLLFEVGEFIFDAGPGADPEQISVPQDEFVTLETWHHVAGVYSGDQIALYVDGEQVASQEANGAALSAPADGRLFIGTKSDLAPEGDWWDGRIDEVAIFDRALSQEEIQGVMEGLAATPATVAAPAAPQASEDPAIFRADGPVTVDGDLSDWGQRGPVTVDASMVADAPEVDNDSDLSVTAHLAYDDEWVYVGAEVTDDVLVFDRTGDAIYQTDSLEFWLGGEQFGAAISDAAPYLHSFGGNVDIEEAEVALVPGESGYTVEVALPRAAVEAALDMTIEAGSSLPVAVGANDSDEEEAERQGQIYFPEGWTWGEVDTFEPLEFTP